MRFHWYNFSDFMLGKNNFVSWLETGINNSILAIWIPIPITFIYNFFQGSNFQFLYGKSPGTKIQSCKKVLRAQILLTIKQHGSVLMALSFMPLPPICPSTPNGSLSPTELYFSKYVHMSQISTSLQLWFRGQFIVLFLASEKEGKYTQVPIFSLILLK